MANSPESAGVKFDSEKIDMLLLPWRELEDVTKVLMFGAKRYSPDNWKRMEDPSRFLKALLRHVVARAKGEVIDPDSGMPHMSHAICEALFLAWHDTEDANKEAAK